MTVADGPTCAGSTEANPVTTPIMKSGRRSYCFPPPTTRRASSPRRSSAGQACSNRRYRYVEPGKPDIAFTIGPIANTNGILSTTRDSGDGWVCRRALTVSNNVAIDATACPDQPADAEVNIADQVAAKVRFTAS
jgi:PknH-like extracellular domain